MAKKTLLDNIIESIKGIDGQLINQSGTTKQMISDLNYKVVAPAKSAADSAVSAADAAVASAQVTSDAVTAIASATAEAKQGANEAMSRAESAWDVATGAKSAVTDFDPLLKSAQSDAGKALTQIADTASALSDAKTAFGSDVATAKELASTAQATADSAVAVASDAKSDATVAIQTASGASLTAIDAKGDATIAKQTASEATVQASNAESDFAQISIRANKIEANVATNSGAIASVQQTANGLTTMVADIKANGGGVNLLTNTSDFSSNWSAWPGQLSISKTTEYNGHPSMVFSSSSLQLGYQTGVGVENSFQYTFSFWAKADNAGDKAHTELYGSIGATDFTLTTNWTHYSAVLTSQPDTGGYTNCYCGVPAGNKGNVYIALPMLEEGTVSHTWSPVPSDLATVTSVANLSATVNGIKAQLDKANQELKELKDKQDTAKED